MFNDFSNLFPHPSVQIRQQSLLHSFMCFDLCWWPRNSSSLVKSDGWWNYAKRCSIVGSTVFLWTKCVLNAVTVPNLRLFLKHKPCDTAASTLGFTLLHKKSFFDDVVPVDDNFLSGQGHFSTSLTENMGHVTLFECIPTKYMELHKHSRQCLLSTYEIVYLERESERIVCMCILPHVIYV